MSTACGIDIVEPSKDRFYEGAQTAALVVDLDGTLTPTDTLAESVVRLIKQSPSEIVHLPFWLIRGRASFKRKVASRIDISLEFFPWRMPFLEFLRREKAAGRRIVLATAADRSIATSVAKRLGLFDDVLSSDGSQNLKGLAKLESIRSLVGDHFVYAGDSEADLPIWKASRAAVLVGVSTKLAERVRHHVVVEREFPRENGDVREWLRALRIHQWLKNLLLFVPLLTAFSFTNASTLVQVSLAFLAFSFTASGTYVVNDLWDLDNDRAHPRKRLRPFASGRIPIVEGIAAAAIALFLGMLFASAVSKNLLMVLCLYIILTSTYSWWLKEYVLIDVLMLSILYTLRIFAGSVAACTPVSSWLLAFSVFIFLSLALVKRCSELVSLAQAGKSVSTGRDYRVADLAILWPLGVGAGISATVVFGLFISAPDSQVRYANPDLLWGVAVCLIYWLSRLWIKTSRGEMHDDPVIYAAKDPASRMAIAAMTGIMLIAHFVNPFGS